MESSKEDTVHLILKVVCQSNKKQYDTFTHEIFPVFQCVKALRRYLLATFKDELAPAAMKLFVWDTWVPKIGN